MAERNLRRSSSAIALGGLAIWAAISIAGMTENERLRILAFIGANLAVSNLLVYLMVRRLGEKGFDDKHIEFSIGTMATILCFALGPQRMEATSGVQLMVAAAVPNSIGFITSAVSSLMLARCKTKRE